MRAAALAEASYSPAGKFASLYWRRVLDATNSAIKIERQMIIDGMPAVDGRLQGNPDTAFRESDELEALNARRHFAVDEYRRALGYLAAKAGLTQKAGSRSINASDLRLMKLRAAEIAEWRRNAREVATHLWRPMSSGITGPSADHQLTVRPLSQFPVADIVERFNGLNPSIATIAQNERNIMELRDRIAVDPGQPMQRFDAHIASDDDVQRLTRELSRSSSDFFIIEPANLHDRDRNSWEPMVVFAKLQQSDGTVRWLRVTRHGDAFANDNAALGQAQNADMPRGNLKKRKESVAMRKFQPGDPHNAIVPDMSGGYGSKHGTQSRASPDVLSYFLHGHRQTALTAGNGVTSMRVWLPQSDLALANCRAMEFLGYDAPYRYLDGRNFIDCLEEAGCKVSLSQIPAPMAELPNYTQANSRATVIRLVMEDRSSYTFAWKANDLSQAFVVHARSVNGKPLSGVGESTIIAGNPVDLLNQLSRAGKTIDRLEMGEVRAFTESRIFPDSGTKTAEAIQSTFNREALGLGVPYHSIRDFENFSRVFAHLYPSACFGEFLISDGTLQQALDNTDQNVLIEFIEQNAGTSVGNTFRYFYEAPGHAGDTARALSSSPTVEEFRGPPSALLQAFKQWKPDITTVRMLSTGPLRGSDQTIPQIPAYLQSDVHVLARAGLPIAANDPDQLRDFGKFLYRSFGSFPFDVNAHTLAKYVESLNAKRSEEDRIGVSYRFRTSPLLDIDFKTPGMLVQYRSDDGMLSNITVFETNEGIRLFTDDHPGVKVPEELEALARTDNWYGRDVVDIIEFSHPALQFFRGNVDDNESLDSMSVDLSASDISLADDTEVEEELPLGTSLGLRRKRNEDYEADHEAGSQQEVNPRPGKRPYKASEPDQFG